MPGMAIILARLSDVRDDDERGIEGQVDDAYACARRLGWGMGPRATHVIIENAESGDALRGVSAFKRKKIRVPGSERAVLRTVRPGFRRALDMLGDGRADGLLAVDLDRAMRDPRDLEDLIDVVEASSPRIPVESVTGSLRLANDADVTMARVMVAVANKASRDTARRVARARLRAAMNGDTSAGGRRPYGWNADRTTLCGPEAAEIRDWHNAILAGVSLRQIAAGLHDRGVPSVTGAPWVAVTVRDMLLRPRNAGLTAYRPVSSGLPEGPPYSDAEIVGPGPWEAIVPESTWRAVCAILTDPSRRNGPGRPPRYLGSLIYLCGKCNDGTTLAISRSGSGQGRYARYTCMPERQRNGLPMTERQWHLGRDAAHVDEFVSETLIARLERPDAADLIQAPEAVDLTALRAEEASLRELLNEQARLHARRVLTGEQLAAGSRELQASLANVRAAITAAEESSPLAGLAGWPGIREIWPGLDLGRRRAVLRALADVTVLPAVRGGRLPGGGYFDSASVRIDWRRE
jgi:site-specific DNA recombinase